MKTKDDAEVNLVVERPGLPLLFIEIKSTERVREVDLSGFLKIVQEFPDACEAICLSNDPRSQQFGQIIVLPWQEGIERFFVI